MLGRMAGGVADAEQCDASLDRGRHAGTAVPPSPFLSTPPKLFFADDSGVPGVLPVPVEAAAVMSPTSTLQATLVSPTTSPVAAAAPFTRHAASSSSDSSSNRRCNKSKSRSHCRSAWDWEAARHAGLGLAGDTVQPAATVLRGQSLRSPAFAADRSARSPMMMSPEEMVEASEDYTRVIAHSGAEPEDDAHIPRIVERSVS